MLNYNEIIQRKYIVLDDEPYEVLSSNTAKKNRQKPVNQTKLKNLITGRVTERAFHQSDTVEEADLSTKKIQYLYNNQVEYWFCEENNPRNRFNLKEELIGTSGKFFKEKEVVSALVFSAKGGPASVRNDEIIGIKLPIKIDLKVAEAPPAVRGNTAQGGTKQITLETGLTINVPLFINEGDIVRINTDTGEYVERVEKK